MLASPAFVLSGFAPAASPVVRTPIATQSTNVLPAANAACGTVLMANAAVAAAFAVGSARKSRRAATKRTRTVRNAFRSERIPVPGGRKLRVAVVGGGPGGACAAETLAQAGIETFLIERKLDNCKPCGGAIPLCMLEEFDLPTDIVDRQVRKMTMISPTNKEVQIGQTLKDDEFIGMVRREVMDKYMRDRAAEKGAQLINGLMLSMEKPTQEGGSYVLTYSDFGGQEGSARKGEKKTLEVDVVIGADGANSRVAKEIDAGDYEYAIAFQERMKIPEEKMAWYEERAEMYVGEDVSPDFYGWVFPKCDHVAVGTGTVKDKKGINKYQQGTRDRAANRIKGGEIIRVEAHPIPEHPRPYRVRDRVALIGDAAGYVTKCSGEGIYFAAKSGRMCAETIVAKTQNGAYLPTESDLYEHLKEWDAKYGPTYFVLDALQKLFYTSDAARESFVELCEEEYVQQVTFDSYLYKTVQGNDPVGDVKLLGKTLSSLIKNNSQEPEPMRELV